LKLLEKLGFHDWDFDYVLLDFLGDVVCGGFGLPIARDMCQKVIVVGSNDLQSLYVANNVCSAVEYFRKLGGNVGVAGLVINKDDGTGEAQAFAKRLAFRSWRPSRQDEDIRRKSANYQIVGKPDGEWAPLFEALPIKVAEAPPKLPEPLDQDGLLNLFSSETGAAWCWSLQQRPTCAAARCTIKPSLEVIYDNVSQGPHDKPQSMCPAFGSLRVGLRMRRTATVLSGSACCVYGLTFVSHFYGARRSVGYVPFNSETLVTGKLFEDIRDAVHEMADPERYDAIVVTNLCVPTASGVPLRLLPDEINGVRIVGIDVPGFGVPTHAEAKDVLAGAMLNYARQEVEAGPVQAPVSGKSDRPTVTLLGEMFPADPLGIGGMLAPLGLAAGPVVPCREWRELYAALDSEVVAAIHPFYTSAIREFEAAGRTIVGSAPVGRRHRRLAAAIGRRLWRRADKVAAAQNAFLPAIKGALAATPIKGTITLSGYEGSELLVARLLIEAGRTSPMSARPVRRRNGPRRMSNGWKPKA
jgi:chlorophyllide reductase subunit Y